MPDDLSDAQVKAMAAIFDLSDAVADDGLSVLDLTQAAGRAVESGHEQIVLALIMATFGVAAAGRVPPERVRDMTNHMAAMLWGR